MLRRLLRPILTVATTLSLTVETLFAVGGWRRHPGIVGWSLGVTVPSSLDLKTETGIGIGSTVAAVKAAYGTTVTIDPGLNGPTFKITAPNGAITGEFDGSSNASRIKTLRAGVFCAP